MAIKCVHLLNGEDIMGDVTLDHSQGVFDIENAVQIVMKINPETGKMDMMLYPWLQFSKGSKLPLSMDHVITIFDPEDQLRNAYSSQFGSGIIVPADTKRLLLT